MSDDVRSGLDKVSKEKSTRSCILKGVFVIYFKVFHEKIDFVWQWMDKQQPMWVLYNKHMEGDINGKKWCVLFMNAEVILTFSHQLFIDPGILFWFEWSENISPHVVCDFINILMNMNDETCCNRKGHVFLSHFW